MSQTKLGSIVESLTHTVIGFVVTLVVSPPIYAFCGIPVSHSQMFWVTVFFTVISIIRGYIIRRFFNQLIHRATSRSLSAIPPDES